MRPTGRQRGQNTRRWASAVATGHGRAGRASAGRKGGEGRDGFAGLWWATRGRGLLLLGRSSRRRSHFSGW